MPRPHPLLNLLIYLMENYSAQFLTVAGLHLLAVISPGPDFIMITSNSFRYSRKTAIWSAFGLALGILVHVTYSLVGLAYIISESVVVFNIIKVCGGLYLVYIGFISITAKNERVASDLVLSPASDLTVFQAIKMGFLTNVLNPKATLFFLSLFTLVIKPSTPLNWKLAYGLEMFLATFIWFASVAFIFSHPQLKSRISRGQNYVQKVLGWLLVILGVKIILTK